MHILGLGLAIPSTCLPLLSRGGRHLYRLGVTASALLPVSCSAHALLSVRVNVPASAFPYLLSRCSKETIASVCCSAIQAPTLKTRILFTPKRRSRCLAAIGGDTQIGRRAHKSILRKQTKNFTKVLYVLEICCHPEFQDFTFIDSGAAFTSQARGSFVLALLIVGNQKLQVQNSLDWHNVSTKFH